MAKLSRIFIDERLVEGAILSLGGAEAHYARDVMRLRAGSRILLFNGVDGEWMGEVTSVSKREFIISLSEQTRVQAGEKLKPGELIFSPLRHAHQDFLIQKATELGVTKLTPALMEHSSVRNFNPERARAIAREAAEQSERLSIPEISDLVPLASVLRDFAPGRKLVAFDRDGESVRELDADALIVGPEGGLSERELGDLKSAGVKTVTLGDRILRAETAAIVGLVRNG